MYSLLQISHQSGNITHDFVRAWEDYDLYKYYKGITSSSTHASGEYYTIYMEGPISNIAYGIVLNKGWNDKHFTERGVSVETLKSYTTHGQPFTELTGKQIEEIFEEILNEVHIKAVENECKELNLEDYQISALTSIRYQYGNIGNFVEVYKNYYLKGDKESFKNNFKDSVGYQP